MIKLLRAAAGISLRATIKYLRGATGIDLGTTIKYLQKPLNYIGLPDFRYSDPTYPHNRSLAPKVWKTGNLNPVKNKFRGNLHVWKGGSSLESPSGKAAPEEGIAAQSF